MVDSAEHPLKWVSALSTRPSLEAAIGDVVDQMKLRLPTPADLKADLGLVFISSAFASELPRLMPLLQERLAVPMLIGCSGGGVIGVNATGHVREVEEKAALSLTLAQLPGVNVRAFHIPAADLPDLDGPPDPWIEMVGVSPQEQPQFILLADPASPGITEVLQGLDYAYPGAVKVGGMADVGSMARRGGLFCNYEQYQSGVVGLALSGKIVMETIVAQGCRPIGHPCRVVEGDRNILMQLEEIAGDSSEARPPWQVLQGIFDQLDEDDRALAQRSLFVGIAQSEFKLTLEPGDFLIRNLIGVDPKTGAIAIADRVRPGQRIQFHLRDAKTSASDLQLLLERYQAQLQPDVSPIGALLFSCVGRGERLYNEPDFDSHLFEEVIDRIPLSGFFCNGEIGPVGNTTFLHGYTSVFGIVRQKDD